MTLQVVVGHNSPICSNIYVIYRTQPNYNNNAGTMVQTLAKRLHHLIVSIARLRKSNTFQKLLEAILYMVKIHSIIIYGK
jgi:hypothetical protein